MPSPDFIMVPQCDDDGWLVGESKAYKSPLEIGVYQLPRGSTTTPAPAEPWPSGTIPRWVAGEWVFQVPRTGGV